MKKLFLTAIVGCIFISGCATSFHRAPQIVDIDDDKVIVELEHTSLTDSFFLPRVRINTATASEIEDAANDGCANFSEKKSEAVYLSKRCVRAFNKNRCTFVHFLYACKDQ